MDIETIAKKLEPLMPRHVQHWLSVRDTATPEVRALVDRQIALTAQKVLGDFRGKTLLSLPPQKTAKGTFHLGTVLYETEKWPMGIAAAELLQNLAIFGRAGSGKTNLCFHLVQQLIDKNVPVLFLDWKRTARHLLPSLAKPVQLYTPGRLLSPFPFNAFIVPPGLEPRVYATHIVDVLAHAYTLGNGARYLVHKALMTVYGQGDLAPRVAVVRAEIDKIPDTLRVRGWKVSALRALQSLAITADDQTNASQEELARTLLTKSTILELDALGASDKLFLVPLLVHWLYLVKLGMPRRESLDLVIVIEEAHHLLYRHEQRAQETLLNRMLRQCREMGIAFIIVDQCPSRMSAAALANCYASVCLNLKDPSDLRTAAGLSLVDAAEKHCFSTLSIGSGILKLQDRWHRPVLLRFPLVDVPKGAVTDALLGKFIDGTMRRAELRRALARERPLSGRLGTGGRHCTEDEFRLLHDVLSFPDSRVRERYPRLGMSVAKGTSLKERLLNRGWLEDEEVRDGKTRRIILRVPRQAQDLLGHDVKDIPPSHVRHEYWKRYYQAICLDQGHQVTMEAPRVDGRVDLLVTHGDERIGIEIETGKSDVVANVKHGLASRFDRMIVVATNEAAMNTVERQLAEAGLLIAGRVILVLRDRYDAAFEDHHRQGSDAVSHDPQ